MQGERVAAVSLVTMVAVAATHHVQAAPGTHRLEVAPSTVAYGYYWSEARPALRVESGDIIDVDTLLTNTPEGLKRAGVADEKIQASLRGRLRLTVRRDMKLTWPRAETSTDYISMGMDPDLTVATQVAIQEMIDFLVAEKHLTRHQAYQLVSLAGNVAVTQLVDKPNHGVHVRLPKSIFRR